MAGRIIVFFAMLTIGALLFSLFNQPVETGISTGMEISNRTVAQENLLLYGQIWDGLLYAVLLISGLTIIAAAVYESNR